MHFDRFIVTIHAEGDLLGTIEVLRGEGGLLIEAPSIEGEWWVPPTTWWPFEAAVGAMSEGARPDHVAIFRRADADADTWELASAHASEGGGFSPSAAAQVVASVIGA